MPPYRALGFRREVEAVPAKVDHGGDARDGCGLVRGFSFRNRFWASCAGRWRGGCGRRRGGMKRRARTLDRPGRVWPVRHLRRGLGGSRCGQPKAKPKGEEAGGLRHAKLAKVRGKAYAFSTQAVSFRLGPMWINGLSARRRTFHPFRATMKFLFCLVFTLCSFGAARSQAVQFRQAPSLAPVTGYAHVVTTTGPGTTIYLSGMTAEDASGKIDGPGDFALQTRRVFFSIRQALEVAGASWADIVKITVFVTDIKNLSTFRKIRDQVFPVVGRRPASSLVQVVALHRPECMIEVEAVAFVGGKQ
jgi:enamine deaminase RidA (YjgF/YER057c/UK114 family)